MGVQTWEAYRPTEESCGSRAGTTVKYTPLTLRTAGCSLVYPSAKDPTAYAFTRSLAAILLATQVFFDEAIDEAPLRDRDLAWLVLMLRR